MGQHLDWLRHDWRRTWENHPLEKTIQGQGLWLGSSNRRLELKHQRPVNTSKHGAEHLNTHLPLNGKPIVCMLSRHFLHFESSYELTVKVQIVWLSALLSALSITASTASRHEGLPGGRLLFLLTTFQFSSFQTIFVVTESVLYWMNWQPIVAPFFGSFSKFSVLFPKLGAQLSSTLCGNWKHWKILNKH